jgi:hypothetical protein
MATDAWDESRRYYRARREFERLVSEARDRAAEMNALRSDSRPGAWLSAGIGDVYFAVAEPLADDQEVR